MPFLAFFSFFWANMPFWGKKRVLYASHYTRGDGLRLEISLGDGYPGYTKSAAHARGTSLMVLRTSEIVEAIRKVFSEVLS